jgi:molybdate transport system ATP-binding protein
MTLDAEIELRLGTLDLRVDLAAGPGEVVAVLGPNGAGKTTLLRTLAGLEPLHAGHLRVEGRVLDDPAAGTFVPAAGRGVGYVPQDHLLFPHLSVLDNVAFGARARGATRTVARAGARGWLDRVDLAQYATERPGVLSGGQAQRAALARALATDPALLLLDEPLAALDVGQRRATRQVLRRRLDAFDGVTVLVTHDPLDALTLAGSVVVLEGGRVTQAGPLAEVVARPRTRYVADLVGTNLIEATVAAGPEPGGDGPWRVEAAGVPITVADRPGPSGAAVFVRIAPSAVALHLSAPGGSPRNVWPATVDDLDQLGSRVRVHLAGPLPLVAEVTPEAAAALGIGPGSRVFASVKAVEVQTERSTE